MSQIAENIPHPVQWHEGMLLLPQHFQHAAQRTDQLIAYHASSINPYFWGVKSLVYDEGLIVGGLLRITAFEVIFPDGLVLSENDFTSALEVRLDAGDLHLQDRPLKVYLCIPQTLNHSHQGLWSDRYTSIESDAIPDLNSGQNDVRIPLLRPRIHLMLGDVPPAGFVSIPLMEVSLDDTIFVVSSYIPPCLTMGASPWLQDQNQRIRSKIRSKLGFLVDSLHGASAADTFKPMIFEFERIRAALTAALVPFEALCSDPLLSPRDLYLSLATLGAHLSAVRFGLLPPVFGGYNHQDIYAAFTPLIDWIDDLLDHIQENYYVVPLTLVDRVFSLELASYARQTTLIFGIKRKNNVDIESTKIWAKNAVIASDEFIHLARDNRVLGATRTIIERVEDMDLMPAKGVSLMRVDVDSRYINPKSTILIFNISDDDQNRPDQIVLYIPKEAVLKQ